MVHHYVPTIHLSIRHFVNFPAPRCCHACSESGHITAFGCSHPPHHPHPGVTLLQHWPQRPFFWEAGTLIGGPPPLSHHGQLIKWTLIARVFVDLFRGLKGLFSLVHV